MPVYASFAGDIEAITLELEEFPISYEPSDVDGLRKQVQFLLGKWILDEMERYRFPEAGAAETRKNYRRLLSYRMETGLFDGVWNLYKRIHPANRGQLLSRNQFPGSGRPNKAVRFSLNRKTDNFPFFGKC
jgi:hypothetical protein